MFLEWRYETKTISDFDTHIFIGPLWLVLNVLFFLCVIGLVYGLGTFKPFEKGLGLG
jgi:ABC-type polysaccharide/polyol phosphate export permease